MRTAAEVIAAAPVPLWGWTEGSGPQLTGAQVPRRGQPAPFNYQGFEQIVDAGAAVRLFYNTGEVGVIELLEGPPEILKASLQHTPPSWSASEERTISVAGAARPVWVMRDEANQHWSIFELDKTLIVLKYQGEQFEDMVLPALTRILPLN